MNGDIKKNRGLVFLTVIYTIGNFSSKVLSFALIFFTTYYLTKEEIGQYDLAIVSISLLYPLVSFQFADSILRWLLSSNNEDQRKEIISTSFLSVMAIVSLFAVLSWGLYHFVNVKYHYLITCATIIQVLYFNLQQMVRGLGMSKLYAMNGVVNSILVVALSVITLNFTSLKVDGLLIVLIIAYAITCLQLIGSAKLLKYFNFQSFNLDLLKQMLKYSIPMIPNSLSWLAISTVNRYFILFFLGAAFNGVFSIALKIPTLITMVANIFVLAWKEKSILTFDQEGRDRYYTEVFGKFMVILFTFSSIVLVLNNFMFEYFVSPNFIEAKYYTPILLLATIVSSLASFLEGGFLGAKKTHALLISTLFGCLTTIVISYFVIPTFKLYGAAFGVLFGFLALLIMRIYQARHIFKIQIDMQQLAVLFGLFTLCSIPTFYDNKILEYGMILGSIVAFCGYNKNLFFLLLKKIRK